MAKIYVKGYHATSKTSALRILTNGFIINRHRKNEWLGYGIYLFKYRSDAQSWAQHTHYCQPNPVIIECEVEVEEEQFLDLDDPAQKNDFELFFEKVMQQLAALQTSFTFKNRHEAMCYGLTLYKQAKNIGVIQYTFTNQRTKKALAYRSNQMSYMYNEVQLCVTDDSFIANQKISDIKGE